MQLACSSAMLDHLFDQGAFTQLEWVDLAARAFPVDGLVFDLRHFPRVDSEYVAELRKLCVDRSLTTVALSVDQLFAREGEALELAFTIAAALGAPLVITDPPAANAEVPAYAWREAAQRGKLVARLAKRSNITVAIRNVAGSLCPAAADLKRLTKDIDSSWIRFAPDAATVNADDMTALRNRSVITVLSELIMPELEPDRKGFLVLEARQPQLDPPALQATIKAYARQWRQAQPLIPA